MSWGQKTERLEVYAGSWTPRGKSLVNVHATEMPA